MDTWSAWIGDHLGTAAGVLWSLLVPWVLHRVRREVRPYLRAEERRRTAQWIAHLADDLTDELRVRYPGSLWTERLDDAVDELMAAADIRPEVARRAIHAAAGRRSVPELTSGG